MHEWNTPPRTHTHAHTHTHTQIAVALGPTVYLWNSTAGSVEELCTMPNAGDYVSSVAWSADGAYLAVGFGGEDGDVRCQSLRRIVMCYLVVCALSEMKSSGR